MPATFSVATYAFVMSSLEGAEWDGSIDTFTSSSFVPCTKMLSVVPLGLSVSVVAPPWTLSQSVFEPVWIMSPSLPSNVLGAMTAPEPETNRTSTATARPRSANERRTC